MWMHQMEVENIEHKELTLDRHNPRFGLSEAIDDEDALRILAETADLEELLNSISERGFENFEPIVATKQNGKIIVLEGNRRVAAVKLLHNPELIAKKRTQKENSKPAAGKAEHLSKTSNYCCCG